MAGMFTLVMGLVFYTAYSNAYEGEPRKMLDPEIFTSSDVFERAPDGSLRTSSEPIAEDPVQPLFFENVDGARTQVDIRFSTPWRILKMIVLGIVVVALPIIIAFALNGFSCQGLHPEGSAVWLCIFVPVSIAYFIKMGRIDIYENPYVYAVDERGRKRKLKTKPRTTTLRDILGKLFSPPLIGAALVLVLFLVMGVYLTLGN